MLKWIVLMPVVALTALVSGCSTTTCSLTRGNSIQAQHMVPSIDKGKLMLEGINFPRFDEPIFRAAQEEWDLLSNPNAKYIADCKFKYELKDTHVLMSTLSGLLWFGTIFTFPMVIPKDMTCSAEIVIRDKSGKIVTSIKTEKAHAEMTTYMSGLPTSWIVHLASSAPINKAGFVSLEFEDVSSEACRIMFKSTVVNELGIAAGKLPK